MRSVLVRVLDRSGKAVPRAKVSVWKSGFFGGKWAEQETDGSGLTEFMLDLGDSDRIDIHVNGTSMAQDQRLQADFRFVV